MHIVTTTYISHQLPASQAKTMVSCPNTSWEGTTFCFNSSNQSGDWHVFYTRAIDYLEALDTNTEDADECHTSWRQLHMMFKGEDRRMLQFLIESDTITAASQKTPWLALDAISTTIKSEEHFWYFQDNLLSNVHQLTCEGIHSLSTHICTLVTQCKFSHSQTKEALKIMALQHAVWYHEARDWIWFQDQSPSHLHFPSHPLQVAWVVMQAVPKGQGEGKGWPHLCNCSNLNSLLSACWCPQLLPQLQQVWCSHPQNKCPAKGQNCYNCSRCNHYTALCKSRKSQTCLQHPTLEVIEVLPEVAEAPKEVDYPKTLTDITPASPLTGTHITTAPATASPSVSHSPPTVHLLCLCSSRKTTSP